MAGVYVAQDWPAEVDPPEGDDWQVSAADWLLSLIPQYRGNEPAATASRSASLDRPPRSYRSVEGARQGFRVLRTEIGELVLPPVIDAAHSAYRARGHDLAATVRAVTVVERALRGERLG